MSKQLPRITVTEFNTDSHSGQMKYIDIDVLRFIKDMDSNNIVVQILDGENFVFFDEFEHDLLSIGHTELLILAQEWIIKHVRIEDKDGVNHGR